MGSGFVQPKHDGLQHILNRFRPRLNKLQPNLPSHMQVQKPKRIMARSSAPITSALFSAYRLRFLLQHPSRFVRHQFTFLHPSPLQQGRTSDTLQSRPWGLEPRRRTYINRSDAISLPIDNIYTVDHLLCLGPNAIIPGIIPRSSHASLSACRELEQSREGLESDLDPQTQSHTSSDDSNNTIILIHSICIASPCPRITGYHGHHSMGCASPWRPGTGHGTRGLSSYNHGDESGLSI